MGQNEKKSVEGQAWGAISKQPLKHFFYLYSGRSKIK